MNIDLLLRETGVVDDPSTHALNAGRARLDAATELASVRRASAMRAIRLRRGRRIGAAALIGVAASVALLVLPILSVGGRPPQSIASAEEILTQAGLTAGEQPAMATTAPYWHSVYEYIDTEAGITAGRYEEWSGHTAPSIFLDTARDDAPQMLPPAIYGPGVDWDELLALPTDPTALDAALRRYSAPDDPASVADQTMWGNIVEFLTASPASPQLRQALWLVAAHLPDTVLGDHVADSTGREGVAVSYGREQIIVDTTTGRILERAFTDDADRQTVTWRATYIEQGPSDTAPAVDIPDLPPGCTLNGC
ncbi:hypothetical protein AGMMS50218_11870 [Actinomycetota bacterium]|nr:hypothetical protein AGMMS50218_11870 [Actinomycetota bacterium]